MYNPDDNKDEEVTPYRATGNLNTSIGIPMMNVNDPMNMNIESINTNSIPQINNQNIEQNNIQSDNKQIENNDVSKTPNINKDNNKVEPVIKKTYISNSDKKKKKVTISLGSEFKIAFLIIVILLAFVLLLPVISTIFD